MEKMQQNREFMKSNFAEDIESDQQKKMPQPPLWKAYDPQEEVIDLPKVEGEDFPSVDIFAGIKNRISHRSFLEDSISVLELSFLLHATQGVRKVSKNNYASLRTVPSGGARHPFETYLTIHNVKGLKNGVYRYLPLTHQLLLLFEDDLTRTKLSEYTLGQTFAGNCAVTFAWSCIPYRGEWRYNVSAHKVMLLDAGHVCQNLYLACEAIQCGTCAIAAYDQTLMDEYLGLDGVDEFVVYMAPVGKVEGEKI